MSRVNKTVVVEEALKVVGITQDEVDVEEKALLSIVLVKLSKLYMVILLKFVSNV